MNNVGTLHRNYLKSSVYSDDGITGLGHIISIPSFLDDLTKNDHKNVWRVIWCGESQAGSGPQAGAPHCCPGPSGMGYTSTSSPNLQVPQKGTFTHELLL